MREDNAVRRAGPV